MRIIENLQDITIESNVTAFLRERGKIVPGSHREGHNVFTTVGRNLLSKLIAWSVSGVGTPFTQRRVYWIGVGTGTQLEVPSVSSLQTPKEVTAGNYLVALGSVEFPTSTSVRFIKEFSTTEITIDTTPAIVTEVGLFADVNPALYGSGDFTGTEDVAYGGGVTVLNPALSTNPPVAYKAFEGITKTQDFLLEVRWDFRF